MADYKPDNGKVRYEKYGVNSGSDGVQQTPANGNNAQHMTGTVYSGTDGKAEQQNAAPGYSNRVTYVDDGQRKTGTVDQSYWSQMEDFYNKNYEDQVAANNKALEEAQARARESNQAQIEALRDQYQGTNRQLYRDYMQRQKGISQQMAAMGYTGGLSESGRLRLENAYGEALADNERSRLGQEAGYNQALSQQLYEAQAAANSANQEAGRQRMSYMEALREAERQDLIKRAATMAEAGDYSLYGSLGYSDKEIENLSNMYKRQDLLSRAAAMANVGDFSLYKELGYSDGEIEKLSKSWQNQDLMDRAATMAAAGDFSLYKELGYSDSDIAILRKLWEAQNPQLLSALYGSSGGGSGGGGSYKTTRQMAEEVREAKAAGATDREILQAYADQMNRTGTSPKQFTPAVNYADVIAAAADYATKQDRIAENMERYYTGIGLPGYYGG